MPKRMSLFTQMGEEGRLGKQLNVALDVHENRTKRNEHVSSTELCACFWPRHVLQSLVERKKMTEKS